MVSSYSSCFKVKHLSLMSRMNPEREWADRRTGGRLTSWGHSLHWGSLLDRPVTSHPSLAFVLATPPHLHSSLTKRCAVTGRAWSVAGVPPSQGPVPWYLPLIYIQSPLLPWEQSWSNESEGKRERAEYRVHEKWRTGGGGGGFIGEGVRVWGVNPM